jgi:beta-glucanase (GH16 family)
LVNLNEALKMMAICWEYALHRAVITLIACVVCSGLIGAEGVAAEGMQSGAQMDLQNDEFVETFSEVNSAQWRREWYVADYQFSHPAFDTNWAPQRLQPISGQNTGRRLTLIRKRKGENDFEGASFRRRRSSQFGRYDVWMKPARGNGVVTGFFTYTGPYYKTRLDEIDIEFLGRDTTKIHLSWWVDGQRQSKVISLGFDAAGRVAHYAFEWLPIRLRWYVQGGLIHEVHATQSAIPQVPGYLYLNLWAVDARLSDWAGGTKDLMSAEAHVERVMFTPLSPSLTSILLSK